MKKTCDIVEERWRTGEGETVDNQQSHLSFASIFVALSLDLCIVFCGLGLQIFESAGEGLQSGL